MPASSHTRRLIPALALAAASVVVGLPVAAQAATVTPAVTPTSPLRIAAASTKIVDASGRSFAPDAPYASGGQLMPKATLAVTGTSSPQLYQSTRLGSTGYHVPVSTPGTYFVDLFLAETRGLKPGQRVWNITAEGQRVATNVDIARDAGNNKAFHVLFSRPVTDGTLNIWFGPLAGSPLVGAAEIDYQSTATSSSTLLSQEFAGPAGTPPSPDVWSSETGGGGWGNNQLQTYTDSPANASTDGNGNLAVTAKAETVTGLDGITRNYTSARLRTLGHFSFQYGTAEARIRVPAGAGLWPAFWALGTNRETVGWPQCGEMDIMENLGSELNISHATVHASTTTGGHWQRGALTTSNAPLSRDFHTYGLVWGPNAMAMTMDGRTYMSLSISDVASSASWSFNHPFYLLLDLAVGGSWPGAPDLLTAFPATMSVDYVRVTG